MPLMDCRCPLPKDSRNPDDEDLVTMVVMIVLMVMMMVQETDGNQGSAEASGGDVQVGERR